MNQQSKIMTRAANRLQLVNKIKKIVTNESDQTKEDMQNYANVQTYHKIGQVKSVASKFKNTTIYNNKKTDRKIKARAAVISRYSKLQYYTEVSMQAYFLAVDLFDKYIDLCGENLSADVFDIALACFMLSIKYEEIYPPNLDQIQGKLGTRLDFKQYLALQIEILKKLEYNLTLQSPIQYLKDFDGIGSKYKKAQVYLYLELASLNHEIRKKYSWKQIVEAVKILFLPLNELRQKQNEFSAEVNQIAKTLIVDKSKMQDLQWWLQRKYYNSVYRTLSTDQPKSDKEQYS